MTLYTYYIREDDNKPTRKATRMETGDRVKANFRRVGRPRVKWHNLAKDNTVSLFEKQSILPENSKLIMKQVTGTNRSDQHRHGERTHHRTNLRG